VTPQILSIKAKKIDADSSSPRFMGDCRDPAVEIEKENQVIFGQVIAWVDWWPVRIQFGKTICLELRAIASGTS
jgi:hypothetical protein